LSEHKPSLSDALLVSHTGLERYERCPLSFKLINIDRVSQGPKNVTAVIVYGNVIHWGMEFALKQGLPASDAYALASKKAHEKYSDKGYVTMEVAKATTAFYWCFQMAEALKNAGAVVLSEWKYEQPLEGRPDRGLLGYVDLLGVMPDKRAVVIDYKGGMKDPDPTQAYINREGILGRWPNLVSLQFSFAMARFRRTISIEFNDEERAAVLKRIEKLYAHVESDLPFEPVKGRHCRFCRVKEHCPLWT
jgi:CRISPR/Cas system-associated exonuclease Cas4 (RecB family)